MSTFNLSMLLELKISLEFRNAGATARAALQLRLQANQSFRFATRLGLQAGDDGILPHIQATANLSTHRRCIDWRRAASLQPLTGSPIRELTLFQQILKPTT